MTSLTRFETEDGIELVIDTLTGESFVTVSGYARMSGKARSTISERLKGVREEEIKEAQVQTAGGLQGVQLLKLTTCINWLLKDKPSFVGKLQIICKQNNINFPDVNYKNIYVKEKLTYKNLEKKVKLRLNEIVNGIVEVPCKAGVADIVTQTQVIEVKKISEWKHAVGQVVIYGLEFPCKETRIHLYGACSEEYRQMIVSYCSLLSIIVSFE